MPMYMSTFHQDFPQLIFHQGGHGPPGPPLKLPMHQTDFFEDSIHQTLVTLNLCLLRHSHM